jgi:hypothetical protein
VYIPDELSENGLGVGLAVATSRNDRVEQFVAFHQLHHQHQVRVALLEGFLEADDVRVPQLRQDTHFTQEPILVELRP